MELREILKIYRNYYKVALGGSFLLALVVSATSLALPPTHKASLTFYVKRRAQPLGDSFYSYDGYYAQQAAERYTKTVGSLLRNPEIVRKALRLADLPIDRRGLKSALRAIEVRETAPQLLLLTVTRDSGDSAKKLAGSLASVVTETIGDLNKGGDEQLAVELLENSPLLEVSPLYPLLNGLVTFLLGMALSGLIISFSFYLRSD